MVKFTLAFDFRVLSGEAGNGLPEGHLNKVFAGGYGGGATPVPIPNTEVKPTSADGTWEETPWESRTPPDFSDRKDPERGPFDFLRPSYVPRPFGRADGMDEGHRPPDR